jgi:hypothetical protein
MSGMWRRVGMHLCTSVASREQSLAFLIRFPNLRRMRTVTLAVDEAMTADCCLVRCVSVRLHGVPSQKTVIFRHTRMTSSWMWRRVDHVWSDVYSKRRFIQDLPVCSHLLNASSSPVDFYTPKMEAIRSSETSGYARSTRRHILEDGILHSHRRENLTSYTFRHTLFGAEELILSNENL